MIKRPLSVTIVGWLFIAAGIVGVAYHATELNIHNPFSNDQAWVLFSRLLAIVGGAFTLRGANWARWLLLVWIAYHVYISFFHEFSQLATHAVLLAVISYFLLRPDAKKYFQP
ncbi:MAG: hypothetical protein Q8L88_13215 [Bacteroidota bacterium]|nr:hypothetical protein [Bacteroidota bacterium]